MIRIVGVQKSEAIGKEFILLQNQGSMRVPLRGHAVVAEAAFDESSLCPGVHFFSDEIDLMPGWYVLLRTCPGTSRWSTTADGHRVYHAYMDRVTPVWNGICGPIHVLSPQHTFCERVAEALLVG